MVQCSLLAVTCLDGSVFLASEEPARESKSLRARGCDGPDGMQHQPARRGSSTKKGVIDKGWAGSEVVAAAVMVGCWRWWLVVVVVVVVVVGGWC
jgi:hypothetical protein